MMFVLVTKPTDESVLPQSLLLSCLIKMMSIIIASWCFPLKLFKRGAFEPEDVNYILCSEAGARYVEPGGRAGRRAGRL